MLIVYENDAIISGTDMAIIQHLWAPLHESFHIKDLGPVAYFLGLEVQQIEKRLILDQH